MGLLLFTAKATFAYSSWNNFSWGRVYDLWQKSGVTLLTLYLWRNSPEKHKFNGVLFPLFGICCLRVIWASIAWIIGLDMNNIIWIGVLFIICCLYILYQSLKNVNR